jgi:hypothetical protein
MCAVCWTGAQIIPVSAAAGRYVWVNHLRGRRRTSEAAPPEEPSPEEQSSVETGVPVTV